MFEEQKLLKDYSTFGIGGPARYLAEVKTVEELKSAILKARELQIPYLVIGKGSNSLFDDRGYDGLVIINKISFCNFDFPRVVVGAGYSFSLLGVQTARKGWSGLEFASGIPGSVGGAIFMNAGANGGETCQTLTSVTFITEEGEEKIFSKEHLTFSYRHSSFQEMKGAIGSAEFHLHMVEGARKKQLEIVEYRTRTQPYGDPSAGCVFRNPTGASAGALIEQCGLKGKRIGGAEVSLLHANFIVNREGATASDVLNLAQHVAQRVKEQTGIALQMEIRSIPYVPS